MRLLPLHRKRWKSNREHVKKPAQAGFFYLRTGPVNPGASSPVQGLCAFANKGRTAIDQTGVQLYQ
jgi:hypothetical protein